eukprot:13322081-Heterocapsa_arctica.AAC.1
MQQKDCQQNKKPRTEEPDIKKDTNNSLLTMLNKRKAEQDQYRSTQSNTKVKTDKKTEQFTPTRVTILSIFAKQQDNARAGARARAPSQSPARR